MTRFHLPHGKPESRPVTMRWRNRRRSPLISRAGRDRSGGACLRGLTGLERRVVPALITPCAPRFSANDSGDILFVASTLLTAPAAASGAANARNGVGTRVNNND